MLSSQVSSVLNRLRGQGADLEFIADVLQDALAAQQADFVGQVRIEMDERLAGAEVQPPDQVGLELDLPTPLTIVNRQSFQKPGGGMGASGGYSMRVVGGANFTPNRPLDVTIDTRFGTILAGGLEVDGTTITPPEDGSGCSQTGTYLFGMVDGVKTCFEVEPC